MPNPRSIRAFFACTARASVGLVDATAFDLEQLAGMKLCSLSWDDAGDLRVRLVRADLDAGESIFRGAFEVTFVDAIALTATDEAMFGSVRRVSVSTDLGSCDWAEARIAASSPSERPALQLFLLHCDEPEPTLRVIAPRYVVREVPARGY